MHCHGTPRTFGGFHHPRHRWAAGHRPGSVRNSRRLSALVKLFDMFIMIVKYLLYVYTYINNRIMYYTCTYIYMCIYAYIYIYIYTYIHTYRCAYIYIYMYNVHMYICTYVHIHICIYIYVHLYNKYIYTYTYHIISYHIISIIRGISYSPGMTAYPGSTWWSHPVCFEFTHDQFILIRGEEAARLLLRSHWWRTCTWGSTADRRSRPQSPHEFLIAGAPVETLFEAHRIIA